MTRKRVEVLTRLHKLRTRLEAERRRQGHTITQWQAEELRRAEHAGLRVIRLALSTLHA